MKEELKVLVMASIAISWNPHHWRKQFKKMLCWINLQAPIIPSFLKESVTYRLIFESAQSCEKRLRPSMEIVSGLKVGNFSS